MPGGVVKKEVKKGDGEESDEGCLEPTSDGGAGGIRRLSTATLVQRAASPGAWALRGGPSFASYGIDTHAQYPAGESCGVVILQLPLDTNTVLNTASARPCSIAALAGSQPPGSVTQYCVTMVVAGTLDFEHRGTL